MRGLTGTAVTRRGLGGALRGECFLSLEAVSVLTALSLTAWSVPVPKVSESARGGKAGLEANVPSACGKSDSRRVNEKQTPSAGSCSAKKICTVQGFLCYPVKTCYILASLSVTPGKMVPV